MKRTLGGDRVGSGKKMQVEMHGYSRSTHNLSYLWRNTMSVGTLVPFISKVALTGDTFDINLHADVKTHPTIGPLFGSDKLQLDVYVCPIRLYQGKLHNNKLGIGMDMSKVKLPVITMQAPAWTTGQIETMKNNMDNTQINPSSILAYLGLRGIGIYTNTSGEAPRSFNGLSYLMYWDIFKNYYSNKMEKKAYVIHSTPTERDWEIENIGVDSIYIPQFPDTGSGQPLTGAVIQIDMATGNLDPNLVEILIDNNWIKVRELRFISNDGGGTYKYAYDTVNTESYATSWRYVPNYDPLQDKINLVEFDLSNLDDMRELILSDVMSNSPFDIVGQGIEPYNLPFQKSTDGYSAIMNNQEGLAVKTYQSDLFNNWLNTEWIDGPNGISEITKVSTEDGGFTIDSLNLANKVYQMLNRIAVSGGTYDDWLDVVYDHERYRRAETPMYMGGMSQEIVFQEVISQAESPNTNNAAQPLGTLAGRGIISHSSKKGGKIVIKIDEPSYIIGIVSITPRIDQSQGNEWDMHLKTMDDFHKPALDEIGFQDLITEQMAWWDTHFDGENWVQKSAGKQPAWINYMTSVNKVFGNFAIENNEQFMVQTRRYETEYDGQVKIKDLTTYIDPTKFNHIFAQTSIDSMNYWVQIAVDITARRKMSAKLIPNL